MRRQGAAELENRQAAPLSPADLEDLAGVAVFEAEDVTILRFAQDDARVQVWVLPPIPAFTFTLSVPSLSRLSSAS